LKYSYALDFHEGLARVCLFSNNGKNGKWGFIDKTGTEIIALIYDSTGNFTEGLAYVKLNDKYGFIDKTGKEIIPAKYDNVSNCFREGIAAVTLGGRQFHIDTNGNEVIA
jgi:hypothetical protein